MPRSARAERTPGLERPWARTLDGRKVEVVANVTADLDANADIEANAVGAGVDADAVVVLTDTSRIGMAAGARILGNTVDITASHQNMKFEAKAESDADAAFGSASADATINNRTASRVDVAKGASVAATDLTVQATQDIELYDRDASADVAGIGLEDDDVDGVLDANRKIDWNGDVIVLSSGSPFLLVDANGTIVRKENVDVIVGPDHVEVAPIGNNSAAGRIRFHVDTVGKLDGVEAPIGVISGTGGHFNVGAVFKNIEFRNQSNREFVIHGIDVANPNARPTVTLDAQSVTIGFLVGSTAGPTDVLIVNEGESAVTLDGTINNPIGKVTIRNTGGSIETASGVVRANDLVLAARDAVGNPGARVGVDLVRSSGMPTDLEVAAGLGVALDLTGRLRALDSSESRFDSSSIEAGGNVDLLLRGTRHETTPVGTVGALNVVVPQQPALSGNYLEKFQPDSASPQPRINDYRLFADLTKSTLIDGTYDFARIVGADITLQGTLLAPLDPKIHVEADTNVGPTKRIHAETNGDITLREFDGDLRFTDIVSHAGNVSLFALNTPTPQGVSEKTPYGLNVPGQGDTIRSLAPASDRTA